MQREEQEALKAEVDHYLTHNTTAMAASEWFTPVSDYVDPRQLEREMRALFRRLPLVAAHGSEVGAGVGAYITRTIMDVPVLLVRQPDGSLRAFLNVCRHRGAKIADEPGGCKRAFMCPYHAWTYRIDGSLIGVPNGEGFSGLDTSKLGLKELPLEERHGFAWIVLTPGEQIDVASYLGDLDKEFQSWGLGRMISERTWSSTDPANWKLLMSGFLENYHLSTLHKTSVAPFIKNNLTAFKSFGAHGRLTNARTRYKGLGKPLDDDFLYGVSVNYFVFPNTAFVWHGTHFERFSLFPDPQDPARTLTQINIVVAPESLGNKDKWDQNQELINGTILGEDYSMARSTQSGLSAGIMREFVFGRNEPVVQHFHKQLLAHMEIATDQEMAESGPQRCIA
ncbi:MAG TPA: aromatic ring-hydroxylating dioxygenase subunit alpha [Ramlibacter sp.]|nr:aromatic ring-hydroxylating dioxygenase subunit alpha [Ramlibacter sp.]